MEAFLNYLFYGIYPYIALAVLAIGSIIRFDREPYSWRSGSSQLLRRKQLIWGSVLFHVGVLFIFFGHLVGLLTPIALFDALGISHGAKQLLAIIAGGVAGVMAIIGATMLIHRRFFDPRVRAASNFSDNMVILLLWVQLALGLATIPLSQGIFTFQADASSHIIDVHPIFKAHLFLGLTILLIFPFTRLVHMLSVPVRYLWRGGYQIVRSRRSMSHG